MVVKNILVKTQFIEKLLMGRENQFISFVSEQGVRDRRTLGSHSMSLISWDFKTAKKTPEKTPSVLGGNIILYRLL